MNRYELPTHQVTIKGDDPGRLTVSLDGLELRTCTHAVLRIGAEGVPMLDLGLLVLNSLDTDLPAFVMLDGPTHEALTAMGWTPPPGQETA